MTSSSIIALGLLALVAGCQQPGEGDAARSRSPSLDTLTLRGAGATFPYPLYSKWAAEYQKLYPQRRLDYQSIGSGGGIRQIRERTVDFGASDVAMTDAELAGTPGPILHIPTTLGAVVISYHLDAAPRLKLTPELVAGIFLGEILSWSDPRIAELNRGSPLPDQPITVSYRADGSGTTAVFTEYLTKVSEPWRARVGAGKSVRFPVGLGGKGNEGVAGQIKTTPGAIGYVELAYAKQAGLAYASLRNQAGRFIAPSLESITAAAAGLTGALPADLRASLVDAPGDAAYPLSAFTYVLVYQAQDDAVKGRALADFLWWAVHDGQTFGAALHYAPLPHEVVVSVEARLHSLRAGGQPLLQD